MGRNLPGVTPVVGRSTSVVDGQALVMSLGRPSECNTFDDLADKFVKAVFVSGKDFDRINVTFDRYRETSIKCATRKKRSRGHAAIRRWLRTSAKSWSNFLALHENKVDLASFLLEKLIAGAPANKIINVGGGFEEEDTVTNIDIRALKGFHEEADTRMILHCLHSDAEFLVVSCQDTDVFLLLVSHFDKMSCKQLWMKAGTSKMPKYLPIHMIRENLKQTVPGVETILSFHAIGQNYCTQIGSTNLQKDRWSFHVPPFPHVKRWCLVCITPILSGVETKKKIQTSLCHFSSKASFMHT